MDQPRDLRWKKLGSEYVYDDRWFKARADRCEFPDGRIIEPYYVVELPNWCNTVVVTSEDKLVLVRQYRYPVDQTTLELPGGVIDPGEDPIRAALREMEEETGYTSNDIEFLMKVAPNPAINNNTAYFFLARNAVPTGKLNFDEMEDIDTVTFTREEAWQLLVDNKMQHGVQVGPLYAAMVRLGWLQFH